MSVSIAAKQNSLQLLLEILLVKESCDLIDGDNNKN